MSTASELPDRVRSLFQGDLDERFGLAYELASVDADGWPRVAMLSHGEITTANEGFRVLLWSGSNTARNLDAGRPALLSVVTEGLVVYISGRATRVGTTEEFDLFEVAAERVRIDKHQGFKVLGPITFGMDGSSRKNALSEWRRQLDILHE